MQWRKPPSFAPTRHLPVHILYRPYVRCLGAALPAANGRAGASASAAEAGGTGRRSPVFAPVSRCAASFGVGQRPLPWRGIQSLFRADFCGLPRLCGGRRKRQEKGIGAFLRQRRSRQPAVRTATRVCGVLRLTLIIGPRMYFGAILCKKPVSPVFTRLSAGAGTPFGCQTMCGRR